MINPPIAEREAERLARLDRYHILDTLPEQTYDDLIKIASGICGAPISMVSLMDRDRHWFKAKVGLEAAETPRDSAFCTHAIGMPDEILIVPDAQQDPRFRDNPLVTGDPHIRFYAGAPLITPDGHAIGTLCVIDRVPRTLQPFQIDAIKGLSRQVVALLELRRAYRDLRHHQAERDWYETQLKQYQRDLEEENINLSRQSGTDALTGLANRHALNAALEWRIARALEGETLHMAIVDIDHFKAINDRYGHQAGDQTLANVASVLRPHDGVERSVARIGGEEFVLLLPALDNTQALRECEKVRADVARMPNEMPVTVSIGVTAYRPGDSAVELYLRADKALYAAKAGGRNRVVSSAG